MLYISFKVGIYNLRLTKGRTTPHQNNGKGNRQCGFRAGKTGRPVSLSNRKIWR